MYKNIMLSVSTIRRGFRLTVCCYHVTYAFQSESTLYNSLNVKEFLARNRCYNWSVRDSNGIQSHNHLVRKQTLKFGQFGKWLSVRLWTNRLWVCIPLPSLAVFRLFKVLKISSVRAPSILISIVQFPASLSRNL